MANNLREMLAESIYAVDPWVSCPGTEQAHTMSWSEAIENDCGDYTGDCYKLADAALSVIRKWLESEAQVEPVARALGTLAGAKFDVFSELTGLPYDDWLAWSSDARAALKSLSANLEGTGE